MTRSGTLQSIREAASNLKPISIGAVAFLFTAAACYAILVTFDVNIEATSTTELGIAEFIGGTVRVIALTTGLLGVVCIIAAISSILTIGILFVSLPFTSDPVIELETKESRTSEWLRER